jgi:hypothetical protein
MTLLPTDKAWDWKKSLTQERFLKIFLSPAMSVNTGSEIPQ